MRSLTSALLLLTALTSCSHTYASKQQAMDACGEWRDKGKFVEFREEKSDFQKGEDFERDNYIVRYNIVKKS